MTLIFLLNLYCDSLLYGMQQALCFVWTQSHHRNLAAWEERLGDSIRWSATVRAEEWPTFTPGRPREQLRLLTGFTLPCAEPSPKGVSKLQPLGHRLGEWDQQAACTWARKLLPVTGWIPVLTWMGPNRKEMNRHRVNILFSKLGSAVVQRVRHVIYYLQEFGQPLA